MKEKFLLIIKLYWSVFLHLQKHNYALLSSALSYQTIFIISPLLFLVINILSFVFDNNEVRNNILAQVQQIYGLTSADFVSIVIDNTKAWNNIWWLNIIFIVLLLFGITGFANQIHYSFNQLWETEYINNNFKTLLKQQFTNLTTIFGLIGLIFILNIGNSILSKIFSLLPSNWIPAEILNQISFTFVFALILYILAKKMIHTQIFKPALIIGTLHASILFTFGKIVLSWYLNSSDLLSLYGVTSSLVILLIWTNFSAQTIFFGLAYAKVLQDKCI